jgi:hypothetical protein
VAGSFESKRSDDGVGKVFVSIKVDIESKTLEEYIKTL